MALLQVRGKTQHHPFLKILFLKKNKPNTHKKKNTQNKTTHPKTQPSTRMSYSRDSYKIRDMFVENIEIKVSYKKQVGRVL